MVEFSIPELAKIAGRAHSLDSSKQKLEIEMVEEANCYCGGGQMPVTFPAADDVLICGYGYDDDDVLT